MSTTLQKFQQVLQEKGIVLGEVIADGELHRCSTVTKPHKRNAAYIAHMDTPAVLWWCNWETGDSGTFTGQEQTALSATEREVVARRLEAGKAKREAEYADRHAEAAEKAAAILADCPQCPEEHPYLKRKSIPPLGAIRQGRDGALLIPVLSANGASQSLQHIFPDGAKRFLTGGKVEGGYFTIPGGAETAIALCEGYATGASIHLATGHTVIAAFSANNLPVVAATIRKLHPQRPLIICADADDTGRAKGREATDAAQARLAVPIFHTGAGKDFNDLHLSEGIEEVRRQLAEPETPSPMTNGMPALVAVDMEAFLSMPLPERGFLLAPILPTQGIAIMYAPRGIGKTFAALSVAVAIAAGGEVFNWRASTPKKVLYIDGEMPAITMQERLAALVSGMAAPPHALHNLTIITPDIQPCPMPDLSTLGGQAVIEPFLKGMNMVVLDNISTLCRTGKENESQSWQPMQSWLLDLRRRGLTVLLIHHAGKSGDQRGTSAREDTMDTVISLRRPREYNMAEGARFEVHLTKARGIVGDDAKSFEAHLKAEGNALHWSVKELEDVELEQLKRLLDEGYTVRDAAEEMGKSKSAVQRLKNKLEGRT